MLREMTPGPQNHGGVQGLRLPSRPRPKTAMGKQLLYTMNLYNADMANCVSQ